MGLKDFISISKEIEELLLKVDNLEYQIKMYKTNAIRRILEDLSTGEQLIYLYDNKVFKWVFDNIELFHMEFTLNNIWVSDGNGLLELITYHDFITFYSKYENNNNRLN